MGPGRAADIIREGMYRGADNGFLLTDRAFAGSDTLATSYAIALALKNIDFDIIVAGRQAIDGDTAQVGPQVAEKLKIPQVTYAESINFVEQKTANILRRLERGVETVECPLPLVVTVNSSAPDCRPRNARLLMKYKHAHTVTELQDSTDDYMNLTDDRPYLNIKELSAAEIKTDSKWTGLSGSPTKVKKIENVVFQAKETRVLSNDAYEIEELVIELIDNHTIG
jgi:electron transfer flavoprotein beta subunit